MSDSAELNCIENRWPPPTGRLCLRTSIPEIDEAAGYLNEAVVAHIGGRHEHARRLIDRANRPPLATAIRQWADSLLVGRPGAYVHYRKVAEVPRIIPKSDRIPPRMPSASMKRFLLERDGYPCRFCGIPVIRSEIRKRLMGSTLTSCRGRRSTMTNAMRRSSQCGHNTTTYYPMLGAVKPIPTTW